MNFLEVGLNCGVLKKMVKVDDNMLKGVLGKNDKLDFLLLDSCCVLGLWNNKDLLLF